MSGFNEDRDRAMKAGADILEILKRIMEKAEKAYDAALASDKAAGATANIPGIGRQRM